MEVVTLKLPEDLLARLDDEAQLRQVTRSALVRESLRKTLYEAQPPGRISCYDLSRDLAGCIKGLPEDLAENPAYMEGFGL